MSGNPFLADLPADVVERLAAERAEWDARVARSTEADDGGQSGRDAYEVVRGEQRLGNRLDEMDPMVVRLARKYARAHRLNFRR